MTTQERLQNYQQQAEQNKAQARQIAGQIADLEETLEAVRERSAMLNGAIQALQAELQAQQLQAQPATAPNA